MGMKSWGFDPKQDQQLQKTLKTMSGYDGNYFSSKEVLYIHAKTVSPHGTFWIIELKNYRRFLVSGATCEFIEAPTDKLAAEEAASKYDLVDVMMNLLRQLTLEQEYGTYQE